ncbi:MAG: hypothetical protein QM765_12720 [Myxococcales bacterium]
MIVPTLQTSPSSAAMALPFGSRTLRVSVADWPGLSGIGGTPETLMRSTLTFLTTSTFSGLSAGLSMTGLSAGLGLSAGFSTFSTFGGGGGWAGLSGGGALGLGFGLAGLGLS